MITVSHSFCSQKTESSDIWQIFINDLYCHLSLIKKKILLRLIWPKCYYRSALFDFLAFGISSYLSVIDFQLNSREFLLFMIPILLNVLKCVL